MFSFLKPRKRKKFEYETRLINKEISRSKRFGFGFGVLALELSNAVPRGLSGILPGKTISYHMLEKNLRLYDQVIKASYRVYFVILPNTDENGVRAVMERINKLAKDYRWIDASMKIATYPKDGETSEELLEKIS